MSAPLARGAGYPERPQRRLLAVLLNARVRGAVALAGVWALAAVALSAITGRVGDWFVMTDELLYERFAISSARTLSPLAHVHGRLIGSLDQLYPLLIAPLFRSGLVPSDLHRAHLLNAWLMSSACIPAFLLARRVTASRRNAAALALASVCVPWIFYASFLLTEVVAYPVFLWALLGMQQAVAAPSRRHDALALAAIALAFLARTQFVVLAAVLPLAIVGVELGTARAGGRLVALRTVALRHLILVYAYGAALVVASVLAALGRLGLVLGSYGDTLSGVVPHGLARAALEHLVTVALGIGILPAVVGLAWFGATVVSARPNRERRAFACLGSATLAAIVLQATVFDLRLGVGLIVYDRYLFYLAPVLLLGLLCAREDAAVPRFALLAASLLVAAGFALNVPPSFEWQQFATLSPDAPITVLYRPLVRAAHGMGTARATLVELTVILTALYALAARRFGSRGAATAAVVFALVAIPAESSFVFTRLFATVGWSGRPLTGLGQRSLDWIDKTVGTHTDVAMIAYPVSDDFFFSQNTWRDLEFWNKSVDRNLSYGATRPYAYTGTSFPRVELRIDPLTGFANVSPTPWVAQSVYETRLKIAAVPYVEQEGILLARAGVPWRAAWISFGLADDGWTRPGVSARVRLFPASGQTRPEKRWLYFEVGAPGGVSARPVSITSNLERWRGAVAAAHELGPTVPVCVPARGYTDVTVAARGTSPIPGDPGSSASLSTLRRGGVSLDEILLLSRVGGPCRPGRAAAR